MSCKKEKKEYSFFKSVAFQSWMSFILLTLMIVGVMLVSFMLVYLFLYGREKVNGATNAAKNIVSSYPIFWEDKGQVERFESIVEENARTYNLSVVVFEVDGELEFATVENVKNLQYYGYTQSSDQDGEEMLKAYEDEIFKSFASNPNGEFFLDNNENTNGAEIVIGAVRDFGWQKKYFCISANVVRRDFTIDFFSRMMLGITILTFALSLIFAYFITRRITSPLTHFSKEIKSFGKDKDHVYKLEGNGYAEIDLLANALNDSLTEQRKTEEFRRDLLANVSHDLRTPLTMIKAYAEMIRDLSGNNPAKRDEHCKIIIDEVERLNTMVGDLLDLSKIQAGTVTIETKHNSLSFITNTAIDRLAIFVEKEGYEFVLDIDEDCVCICDRVRMGQAIYNLVCNAVNYTGEDKKVFISLKKSNGIIRFEVRDTGKGIKKEEQEYIWDRYYRTQRSKRNVAGSGIGLSIVQSLFKLQGVSYGVISEENEGAIFWFEIAEIDKNDD